MKYQVNTIKYPRGTQIISESDQVLKSIYQVLYGRVSVYRYKGDEIIEMDILRPGDFLGEFSFIDKKRANINAEAIDDVELMEIPISKELTSYFDQTPPIIQQLIYNIARKNRRHLEKVRKLQHFENISYDHLKAGVLKSYHLKDFHRLSQLLIMYVGLQRKQNISFDDFEEHAFILLQRTNIRLNDFFRVLHDSMIVDYKDTNENVKIKDIQKLEDFIDYLRTALRNKETYVYLKTAQLGPLKLLSEIIESQSAKNLFEIRDGEGEVTGYQFSEDDLVNQYHRLTNQDIENLPNIQILVKNNVFEKSYHPGKVGAVYKVNLRKLNSILKFQPVLCRLSETI